MTPSLPLLIGLLAAPVAEHPVQVWQVAPDLKNRPWFQVPDATGRKERAAVLVPGLKVHPIQWQLATKPELHAWGEPRSELVKALSSDFDVFVLGYAQTLPVDAIVHAPALREAVGQFKTAGYKDVVLIGHSAGGLIARQFMEAYPQAGATKVVQVASPNGGSDLAALKVGYHKVQASFIHSLAPAPRLDALRGRRLLGPGVEAACVVCKVRGLAGDGLVPLDSQWAMELQMQGVPAALVTASHWEAMKGAAGVRTIAELARGKLTRWSPEQVDQARRVLFREPDEKPKP